MLTPSHDELVILRWPEVSVKTGFRSKSHVEKLERQGDFPRSIKLGARAKGWLLKDINEWILSRLSSSHESSSQLPSQNEQREEART